MGYLDAQAGDAERTAFRRAEKRYKFYKHASTSARSTKHRESVPPTDLSEVLDFRRIRYLGVTKDSGITRIDQGLQWPVFTIDKHPGFYFIPEALEVEEQMHWIKESLTSFPQPPNRTNHTAVYGPLFDLWSRAQNMEVIEQTTGGSGNTSQALGEKWDCTSSIPMSRASIELACLDDQPVKSESDADHICQRNTSHGSFVENISHDLDINTSHGNFVANTSHDTGIIGHSMKEQHSNLSKAISMKTLLRKLRWATLGLQFDWSKRAYDLSLPHNKIPRELSDLAAKLANPAMNEVRFHAEAAIVNYFGYDDMLGGHLDDMEADWNKPIVSISFGCKAIFLLGGPSREENPTAMFLRSGDVVLMAGSARGCFHGVPRIFVDPEERDVPDFPTSDPSYRPFIDYIKMSRINLNIRQVF